MAVVLLAPLSNAVMASSDTATVHLYFLIDGQIAATNRMAPGDAVESSALDALYAGPAVSDLAIGQRTALPPELASVDPLKIDAKTKTAMVSLPSIFRSTESGVEARRTAQIVYTLTQFPTITSVSFVIDGSPYDVITDNGKRAKGPVDRTDYESLSPAILIESAAGAKTLHITGTANVFEATLNVELYDASNHKIASDFVTATSGTGTRGAFEIDLPYKVKTAQSGALLAYEASAKDGSRINVVAVPVVLSPK